MPDLDSLTADQRLALLTAAKILQKEFAGVFSTETIELFLQTSYDQFADREVHELPAAHGGAVRTPAAHGPGQVEGKHSDGTPIVLFLCVHNGPVADGIGLVQPARRRPGDRLVGRLETRPRSTRRRSSRARAGINIQAEFPKPWTDEILRAADVVVTMGCGDACPIFPGKRYEDWELDDPEGLDVEGAPDPRRDRGACFASCWPVFGSSGDGHPVTVWQLTVVLGHIDSMRLIYTVGAVNKSIERRAALHAALGEPVRLAIVEDLAATDRAPTDLATRHGRRAALLAHHLDVLERVGLIERHVSAGDRRRRYIRLRHAALRDLVAVSRPGRGAHCSSARTTRLAPSWPPRCGGAHR